MGSAYYLFGLFSYDIFWSDNQKQQGYEKKKRKLHHCGDSYDDVCVCVGRTSTRVK